MRQWIFTMTAATVLVGLSFAASSPPAQADDYWDGYWSWYDGTYRPYVTRRYSYYGPYRYGYTVPYSGTYYDGPYYGPGDGYYYGGPYYGRYYGTPRVGYRDLPGGGGQVQVGPLRFGWR